MAAPCGRMASRCFMHLVKCFERTRVGNTASTLRQFSVSSACRVSLKAKDQIEPVASPWTLMGSVWLQRLPVISRDKNPLEEQLAELMYQTFEDMPGIAARDALLTPMHKALTHLLVTMSSKNHKSPPIAKMELEKSLLADHELRLLEDTERLRRKQSDDYDSDDEEERRRGDEEIVLAQDLEDTWEQKLKQFVPEPRTTAADLEEKMSSLERCLADSLVLLVEQKVGEQKHWLLPQINWETGETLRQTAERALASSLPEAASEATFLGNTPCGVYKYKVPRAMRTETFVGAKVFFFKAVLSNSARLSQSSEMPPFMWVKKSELQDYLKPAYLEKVNRFVLDL